MPAFDKVFGQVFGGRKKVKNTDDMDVEVEEESVEQVDSETPEDMDEQNIMEREGGQDAMQMNAGEGESEDEEDTEEEKLVPLQEASEEEALSHKNFQALNAEELALLYKLMVRLQLATPERVSRRKQRGRHGEHMDMRRTLRKSLHTGGDPIVLARKRRRSHPRRLVLLCDISGSMEPYARAYLQFMHAARATGPYAEAFVFATRLTRLTKQLAGRNPQRAIRRATEAAPDWSSGTRIGDALKHVQRPLRAARDGARLGHRDPVRRLGARRPRPRRRARCSACRGWPTGSCGSTRAWRRRTSHRRPAASSRRCRTATRSSAATR